MDRSPIVVGFDGSPGAQAALRWALDDAARRGVPVQLVYALDAADRGLVFPEPWDYTHEAHEMRAQALVAKAASAAVRTHPTVDVVPVVLTGPAVGLLCERSRNARMVVLGSRGPGHLPNLLVGSTGVAVATHAHCPVLVVRDSDRVRYAGKPILVGVDDSAEAHLAVAFAMEEAAVREVDLVAMRAWNPPSAPWRSDVRPLVLDVAELETAERHALDAAVDAWSDKYPAVPVTRRLVSGDARHALAAASADAQLIAVGSRGRGGFAGLALGSVSQYLLQHAACPVAVMRRVP